MVEDRLAQDAALENATGGLETPLCVLVVRGPDALPFLHRMSTADLEALSVGASALTCFPDRKGRVRALALVHRVALHEIWVIESPGAKPGRLLAWLDGFLFSEDLEMHARDQQGFTLIGTAGAALLEKFVPGLNRLERFCAQSMFSFGREKGTASFGREEGAASAPMLARWFDLGTSDLGTGDGGQPWHLLISDEADNLASSLFASGLKRLHPAALEGLRIAAGVPGPAELNEKHNPLELALHDSISWSKGCYPGQEVISRIDNYDKQGRHLVGLKIVGDQLPAVGATLLADSRSSLLAEEDASSLAEDKRTIGAVTSVVDPAHRYGIDALAMVKSRTPMALSLVTMEGILVTTCPRSAAQVAHD